MKVKTFQVWWTINDINLNLMLLINDMMFKTKTSYIVRVSPTISILMLMLMINKHTVHQISACITKQYQWHQWWEAVITVLICNLTLVFILKCFNLLVLYILLLHFRVKYYTFYFLLSQSKMESFRRPAFTELLDELGEVAESLELPAKSDLTTSWVVRVGDLSLSGQEAEPEQKKPEYFSPLWHHSPPLHNTRQWLN